MLVPCARGMPSHARAPLAEAVSTHPYRTQQCTAPAQVGLVACNDYIILESCIYRILQKHFGAQPYYAQLLDFFHEVNGPVDCASSDAGAWVDTGQGTMAMQTPAQGCTHNQHKHPHPLL